VRYWLIGCGTLVIIAGALAFFAFRFFKAEIDDLRVEMEHFLEELDALEREYSFDRPEDGIIPEDRYRDFLFCRRSLKRDIDAFITGIADDDLSIKERISMVFDMIPTFGNAYVRALRGAAMPPEEYGWYRDQTLLVIRYGEHPDAPAGLKDLRRDLDSLSEEDNPFRYGENVEIGEASEADSFADLLPDVDPLNINLPAANIETVLKSADAIRETKELFFFDTGFSEAIESIKREAE
jgi:hypothetical protein